MNARPNNPDSGPTSWLRRHPGTALVYFILLPIMACAVLMLPPIALPSRLANAGYVPVNTKGMTVNEPDGFELTIPENATKNGTSVRTSTLALDAFMKSDSAHTLPAYLEPRSPLYQVQVQGEEPKETQLFVPIPLDVDSLDALDVYALWQNRWFKIPFTTNTDDGRFESVLNFAPQAVLVVESQPRAPVIASNIANRASPPDNVDNILVQVNPQGLQLADSGGIAGEPVSTAETNATSNFAVMPTVTNVDANGARTDLTGNMISDEAQRTAHINALVDLAVQKVYRGYNVAYDGIGASDEPLFTAFIKELARKLHEKEKTLSVTLPAPTPIAEDLFDTGGYNWALIGRYADEVKIPLLSDPRAYEGEPPLQTQYLKWAVSQIDRSKIQLITSVQGRDSTADTYRPIAFDDALKLVGTVHIPADAQPGSKVTLELEDLKKAGGIQLHEPSGLFYFNYEDGNGTAHTVWLENASSLAKKVEYALNFNLGGIAINDYDAQTRMDDRAWTVLENYKSMQPTIVENQLTLVWSVNKNKIGTSSVTDPKIVWDAPKEGDKYDVQVALSVDGGTTAGKPVGNVVRLARLAPTPLPTAPPEPTDVPSKPVPTKATSSGPKPTTAAPAGNPTPKPPPPPLQRAVETLRGRICLPMGSNWTGRTRTATRNWVR